LSCAWQEHVVDRGGICCAHPANARHLAVGQSEVGYLNRQRQFGNSSKGFDIPVVRAFRVDRFSDAVTYRRWDALRPPLNLPTRFIDKALDSELKCLFF